MHLVWDTFEVNQPPFILIRELKLKTRIKSAKFDLRVVSARRLHSYLLHIFQRHSYHCFNLDIDFSREIRLKTQTKRGYRVVIDITSE